MKIAARRLRACAFGLAFACAGAHAGEALDSLNFFFNEIRTFEARFGQVVLNESLQTIDRGQGRVRIKRPGLFRWDYDPPEQQQIIGDGARVWIYDIELEQIILRDQAAALGKTPAILLADDGDLAANYRIEEIGTQGRFDWVNLIPKDSANAFTEVRVGFEDKRLRLMELIDELGQRTRLSFVDLKENAPIDDQVFHFTPPPGVDVIDESGG